MMKHFKRWLEEQDAPPLTIRKGPSPPPKDDDVYDPAAIGGKDAKGQGASKTPGSGTGSSDSPSKKGNKLSTVPPLPPVIDVPTLPTPATPSAGQSPKPSAEPKNIGTSGDAGRNPYRDSGGGFGTTGNRPEGGAAGPSGSNTGSGPGKGGTGTGTGDASKPYSSVDWSKVREYGPNTGRSR